MDLNWIPVYQVSFKTYRSWIKLQSRFPNNKLNEEDQLLWVHQQPPFEKFQNFFIIKTNLGGGGRCTGNEEKKGKTPNSKWKVTISSNSALAYPGQEKN